MKKLVLGLVSLLVLLSLVGCGTDKKDPVTPDEVVFTDQLLQEGTLIVGTSPDYPPYESLNTNGEIEGFDVDMVHEVVALINAKYGTSIKVEFQHMDFDTIIGALQAKTIDVGLSAFTYSPDRDVIFSTPYLTSKQVVVVNAGSDIVTLADLEGKTLAAGLGTTGYAAAEEIPNATVTSLGGDYQMMFVALEEGQIDAVVCDEAVADNYVAEKGFVKLEETLVDEENSIIIENANTVLAQVISDAIAEFVESDKYQELKEKWNLAD